MSEWLDPTGRTSFGIAICDRCKCKFSVLDLLPDPNSPGLRVCVECRDLYDPYRLPARQTERIALQFTRPDEPLTFDAASEDAEFFVIGVEPGNSSALATEGGVMLEAEGIN
jgi:hypothetical protein